MPINNRKGAPINTKRILATLDERRRWEQRRVEVEKALRIAAAGERAIRKLELANIIDQISYYDSLLKEMKRELRPADRSSILSKG